MAFPYQQGNQGYWRGYIFVCYIFLQLNAVHGQYDNRCFIESFVVGQISSCYQGEGLTLNPEITKFEESLMNPLIYKTQEVCLNQGRFKRIIECIYTEIGPCINSDYFYPTLDGFEKIATELCSHGGDVDFECVAKQHRSSSYYICLETIGSSLFGKFNEYEAMNEFYCLQGAQNLGKCSRSSLTGCGCNISSLVMNAFIRFGTPQGCPSYINDLELVSCADNDGMQNDGNENDKMGNSVYDMWGNRTEMDDSLYPGEGNGTSSGGGLDGSDIYFRTRINKLYLLHFICFVGISYIATCI